MAKKKLRILVVNGPNLGHLGVRQPEIYGSEGMDAVPGIVRDLLGKEADDVVLDYFQSNFEGGIVDRLTKAWEDKVDGLVINAGAYTHTSLALGDCLAWIGIPCVEVHLSNLSARTDEPLRQRSFVGRHSIGVIAGFGILGYGMAVQALCLRLRGKG
ncbi:MULTISPECIES: type II 3-dehydroquinate dehydratase [Desulfovibrio]|jgi:3-dehydroquinate dehydratase-2|uniref:type II 3-dehydroquinate dehydratase n=1 Tax=Desulfovibrio TaxID=872 RepID=UPI0003FF465C|nr:MULTISPECIES: type II 3-dehydroquinate dehydratase [Desulfovibrio]HMM38588.1 type II 3-dehydroquinate dehydratase [Desulfovibrio sp.]